MAADLKLGTLAALVLISLVLCRGQYTTTYTYGSSTSCHDCKPVSVKKVVKPEPEPEVKAEVIKEPEPECKFEPSFTNVENSLRSFIFLGDVKKAAEVLNSNRTNSLAAGSTYNADQQCLVVQSENRERDPDVVAFRAVALNVLKTKDAEKMANVIVDSFTSDCQTCLFSADELDDYVDGFLEFLSDEKNLIQVLEQDPNQDGEGRKLLVTSSSPTNSLHCAHCYPSDGCRRVRWCRRN